MEWKNAISFDGFSHKESTMLWAVKNPNFCPTCHVFKSTLKMTATSKVELKMIFLPKDKHKGKYLQINREWCERCHISNVLLNMQVGTWMWLITKLLMK